MGRAMMEADRSILRGRGEREERRGPGPRLSPEDMRYTEELKRRHQEMEVRVGREEGRRGRLAMDCEDRGRAPRVLPREGPPREEMAPQPEEMRIIVRRELTPETPPKKIRLEDEDAELLEMRRKALESLMKRTDKELELEKSPSPSLERRRRLGRLQEESSESSDTSDSEDSTDESELSEVEEEGKAEPTFVVTLDGLDNKYFQSNQKGVLERAREKVVDKHPAAAVKKTGKRSDKKLERVKREVPGSKVSSDGELELHPSEDFEDQPKKVVHKVSGGQEVSDRPTMAVAARKRSPILGSVTAVTKKVAEVKPVVSTAAVIQPTAAKLSKPTAAKLAGSYAEKLAAIRAAKAAKASQPEVTAPKTTDTLAEKAPKVPTTKDAPKVAPKAVAKPVSAPAKPVSSTDSPAKTRVKRTPITAPSPETAPAPAARFLSAPAALAFTPKVTDTVCRFWPNCKRGDACAFYHPAAPVAKAEAVLSIPANANKFKWSAK